MRLIRKLKEMGYRTHLFFLYVENVDVALSRIKDRVQKGGHDVPDHVVLRRFKRSLLNFFRKYQDLVDSWYLFDNTSATPTAIAFKKGARLRIIEQQAYENLRSQV